MSNFAEYRVWRIFPTPLMVEARKASARVNVVASDDIDADADGWMSVNEAIRLIEALQEAIEYANEGA